MSKVMVVDDAEADRAMIEAILRRAGHSVVAYDNGERLEENLAAELPDVLLLDVVMPKRNGFELLRRVKKDDRIRHTPVVLVTCRSEDSDRLWGKRQGADGYVAKPFTSEELLGVIRYFTAAERRPSP
jgi:twitching motility two-component system response regulator PilH